MKYVPTIISIIMYAIIGYCLHQVDKYLGLAYIIYIINGLFVTITNYQNQAEQNRKMVEELEERINANNSSDKGDSDNSSNLQ